MYLSDIASEGFYQPSRGTRNGPGSTRDLDSIAGGQAPRRSSHAYHDRVSPSSPVAPTSIPLDDSFDAYTTEVPTEWAVGDRHAEYERDESVSGYRNYVTEMERMLSGQMENAARMQRHDGYRAHSQQEQDFDQGPPCGDPELELEEEQMQAAPYTHARPERTLRRSEAGVSESARGSSRSRLGEARRRNVGQQPPAPLATSMQAPKSQPSPLPPMSPPPDNARQVSGKKGQVELVEQRILEDTPARTISLWRERVAQSVSGGGSAFGDELRSETDSHAHAHTHRQGQGAGLGHRRGLSGSVASDARLRRVASEQPRYPSPLDGGGLRNESLRGTDNGRSGRASYERSEYMISYQQATKGGLAKPLSPRSEAGSTAAFRRDLRTPSSPTLSRVYEHTPPSPTVRRHVPRKSLDRSEYMTYPQTPPRSGSQASSGPAPLPKGTNGGGNGIGQGAPPRSPRRNSFREDGGSVLRATSTSSVEIILSSCDPSLLHIAPALYELGIKRVDHLRAIARLSEETRDREVKEQALKRGVSVVEWAIFLDRLQSL